MKPLLVDLFCCAGGAAMGYARAGFDVLGVDIQPQPNYPFRFEQADALDWLREEAKLPRKAMAEAYHASPPCQALTTMSNRHRGKGGKADSHVNLIEPTWTLLHSLGRPFVIENVPGARGHLQNPILLHGGMFGLRVQRPRLFESNVDLVAPKGYASVKNPIGVYGRCHDGRRLFTRKDGSIQRAARSLAEAREAMGIDWMTWPEITEAIPPAYTEYLGKQLLGHIAHPKTCGVFRGHDVRCTCGRWDRIERGFESESA